MKKIKNILRNEKGLTLIELLAVVVILGIIAAIAIPAISGIIENSKKDAYISSAEQVISSAKLAIAAGDDAVFNSTTEISVEKLEAEGYIETSDPADKANPLTGTVTLDTDGEVTGITLVGEYTFTPADIKDMKRSEVE